MIGAGHVWPIASGWVDGIAARAEENLASTVRLRQSAPIVERTIDLGKQENFFETRVTE